MFGAPPEVDSYPEAEHLGKTLSKPVVRERDQQDSEPSVTEITNSILDLLRKEGIASPEVQIVGNVDTSEDKPSDSESTDDDSW